MKTFAALLAFVAALIGALVWGDHRRSTKAKGVMIEQLHTLATRAASKRRLADRQNSTPAEGVDYAHALAELTAAEKEARRIGVTEWQVKEARKTRPEINAVTYTEAALAE